MHKSRGRNKKGEVFEKLSWKTVFAQQAQILFNRVNQQCLAYELEKGGHTVACEVSLPVSYGDVKIDLGFRIDMMVDKAVIIENKTVENLLPIYPVK